MINPKQVPRVLKHVYSAAGGKNVLYVSVRLMWPIVLSPPFPHSSSIWMFYPLLKWGIKSLPIPVLLSMPPSNSVNVCFICVDAYIEVECTYVVMVNFVCPTLSFLFSCPRGSLFRCTGLCLLSSGPLGQQRDAQPALALSGPRHLE